MKVFGQIFAQKYLNNMSLVRPGFSTNTEVEASSFSVWNCVITFLQILLVSTMLYGAEWNHGQLYSPENYRQLQHFRTIAFFFSVWALQSVALALLLVWAIGKRSYHLCHSWVLCEALMQVFIVLSAVYFTYCAIRQNERYSRPTISYMNPKDVYSIDSSTTTSPTTIRQSQEAFQPPKHLAFLIILHFLIKGFGFWIVCRYMRLLKTTNIQTISNSGSSPVNGSSVDGTASGRMRELSPPPSYAHLCKEDDLPCYDEALRLCVKETPSAEQFESTSNHVHDSTNSLPSSKNILAPV